MEPDWVYWNYVKEDYDLIREWAEAHQANAPHPDWLSDTGFVLCRPDPKVICFLYHDPSCRAAFLDYVYTKPKTPVSVLKDAIVFCMTGPIQEFAACRGIHTILTRSPLAMARVMLHTPRWLVSEKDLVNMVYYYSQEEVSA